jgi:pyrroline-5-carboxylate reductase
LAHLEQESPELAAVARAWPNLPAAVRAGIVAMVGAVEPVADSTKHPDEQI